MVGGGFCCFLRFPSRSICIRELESPPSDVSPNEASFYFSGAKYSRGQGKTSSPRANIHMLLCSSFETSKATPIQVQVIDATSSRLGISCHQAKDSAVRYGA